MTYANITPAELIENNAHLKIAYDVNQTIERLFEILRMPLNMRMRATIPTPHSKS